MVAQSHLLGPSRNLASLSDPGHHSSAAGGPLKLGPLSLGARTACQGQGGLRLAAGKPPPPLAGTGLPVGGPEVLGCQHGFCRTGIRAGGREVGHNQRLGLGPRRKAQCPLPVSLYAGNRHPRPSVLLAILAGWWWQAPCPGRATPASACASTADLQPLARPGPGLLSSLFWSSCPIPTPWSKPNCSLLIAGGAAAARPPQVPSDFGTWLAGCEGWGGPSHRALREEAV